MKKNVTLGILLILFVFMLTGCGEKYLQETQMEAVVIQCEEGTFHNDVSCESMANMYLAQKNLSMWSLYKSLAKLNGKYDYNVKIIINGEEYTVVREEQYEVGQIITITEVRTYRDGNLINVEYK